MANRTHLDLLKQGVDAWNSWRRSSADKPDLKKITGGVSGAKLAGFDLSSADLRGSNLTRADLRGADLSSANLEETELFRAELMSANLTEAKLFRAVLYGANLSGANLSRARLDWAVLQNAWMIGADLSGANLSSASLVNSVLERATMTGTVLEYASLVGTKLTNATLVECRVFGISAWNVDLTGSVQSKLFITQQGSKEPAITVDDLEVAQFIYLVLNNTKLRKVIGTITSKAVLILGRFTEERKPILDAIKDALRNDYDLVPIVCDFPPDPSRDLTETVQLLAGMCKCVIADLTDARSVPQELSHIIPLLPSLPVQPIISASESVYSMFEHWRRYSNVLPTFAYRDIAHLISELGPTLIPRIVTAR